VGDCTDMAKISEGKIQIEKAYVNLNQIVMASVDAIGEMAAERGINLATELSPMGVTVLGDAMRLEQVIMNLLINAIKYTNGGGLVSIRTELVNTEIRAEIKDTGIGIDRAFLEQIFEPFRQGTTSWLTSRSGLGLGLAIARRIVELHGGKVWAESQGLGYGSTFCIRLPLAIKAQEERHTDAPAERTAGKESAVRILLIEDSDDILFLMKSELEMMGHTVITAVNGHLGMEAAQAHRPDLIISDVKMPVVDGYQLMRTLRGIAELSAIPAIALTGFGSKEYIERARAAGFDACLSKPSKPEEIGLLIRQLTEKKRPVPAGTQTRLT
jgi:two-component system CheB/CheR fusion protein